MTTDMAREDEVLFVKYDLPAVLDQVVDAGYREDNR
jgi:hypothetical protein